MHNIIIRNKSVLILLGLLVFMTIYTGISLSRSLIEASPTNDQTNNIYSGEIKFKEKKLSSGAKATIDIGLFNTDCAEFEVRITPSENILNSAVTNIQFAVKWPENTVNIINPSSDYDVTQQGPVIQNNGFNYAVFVSTTGTPVDWYVGQEYVVLSFEHDQTGAGYGDMVIGDDAWTQNNNAVYYLELLGTNQTGTIYHDALYSFFGICEEIDIGLFNTTCANFEVRARPHDDHISTSLTNIQFTIKWKAGTVDISNIESDFDLEPQGPATVFNDTNYLVFATVTGTGINWNAEQEYTILTFRHTENGTDSTDFYIGDDSWTAANNGVYYIEILGIDKTGDIYHYAQNVYLGSCEVWIKVWLQGPYNQTVPDMFTHINDQGDLPAVQPYNLPPWNYSGSETVLNMPDTVVDWILVELRDGTDETVVVDKRAGLLLSNGYIIDTNLTDGLRFDSLYANSGYYIAVWHRNHMPVMSGNTILLPNPDSAYDFTEVIHTQPYRHNDPYPAIIELEPSGSGNWGMIAGDVNSNGELKYVGVNNDRDFIAARIVQQTGQPFLHNVAFGYYDEDVNMNDTIRYIGIRNDRDIIIANLVELTGSILLTSVYQSVVPGAYDSKESGKNNKSSIIINNTLFIPPKTEGTKIKLRKKHFNYEKEADF